MEKRRNEMLDRLATGMADTAMRAAALWLRRSRQDLLEEPDWDALVLLLRAEVRAAVHPAMRDAEEALETVGEAWAQESLRTDFALAGTRAAAAYAEAQDRGKPPAAA